MLEINNLNVFYDKVHAVKDVNIKIRQSSIVTLLGANGAGKSSVIRSIMGLNKQVTGSILYISEESITKIELLDVPCEQMVNYGIALVPEGRRILPGLTVEENIMLGAFSRDDTKNIEKDKKRLYSLFPRLKERTWQKGETLSGGEQQMLALARALISKPELLILDEPSLGLAPLLVREIFNIIQKINENGTTILLVEQNASAALTIADYAYILETGSVTLEGRGRELLRDSRVKSAYLGL